jgi:GAF domain-containing protein
VENERLRLRIEALERLAAESRQAEEARRESEECSRRSTDERRRHEAEVLGRVTPEINGSLNLDTVLARVAEGARELCGADVVGVALRESGSEAMVFRFWSGLHGVNNAALRVGEGNGLAAQVLETRRAARTARYAADPRVGPDYQTIAGHETITALMAVPMLIAAGSRASSTSATSPPGRSPTATRRACSDSRITRWSPSRTRASSADTCAGRRSWRRSTR